MTRFTYLCTFESRNLNPYTFRIYQNAEIYTFKLNKEKANDMNENISLFRHPFFHPIYHQIPKNRQYKERIPRNSNHYRRHFVYISLLSISLPRVFFLSRLTSPSVFSFLITVHSLFCIIIKLFPLNSPRSPRSLSIFYMNLGEVCVWGG